MAKWPVSIALLVLSAAALAVVMFMFPVYEVINEGEVNGEKFTVTESYYVDHYEIECNNENVPIIDTDSDGVPDSTTTGAISYKDQADFDNQDQTDNFGWAGSYEDHGQKEKSQVYEVTYWGMIVSLAFAGISLILTPISGFRKLPIWLPRISYALFIVGGLVVLLFAAIMFAEFGGAAYQDDERENFYVMKKDIQAEHPNASMAIKYEKTEIGDSYMGELKSEQGSVWTFTHDPVKAYGNASQNPPQYIPETEDIYWTSNIGTVLVANYALSQTADPAHDEVTVGWSKTSYRPHIPGWFILIAPVFLGLIAVFLVDQNLEKVDYKKKKPDSFQEDYSSAPQPQYNQSADQMYGQQPQRQQQPAYQQQQQQSQRSSYQQPAPTRGGGQPPPEPAAPGPGPGPIGPAPLEDESYDQY